MTQFTPPTADNPRAGGLTGLRVGGSHIRPSDIPGCVEVSAEFLCAMAMYGDRAKPKKGKA